MAKQFKAVTFQVNEPNRLPTCLTGIALRVDHFTVQKKVDFPKGRYWAIHIPQIHIDDIEALLAVLPAYEAEVIDHQIVNPQQET